MRFQGRPHNFLACLLTLVTSLSLTSTLYAADALKVGVVSPITGATATFGQENVNGIKLAYEKIK